MGIPVLVLAALLLPPANPGRVRPSPAGSDPFTLRLSAPITTWDEAVPLGNGLTGGLLWGEGRTLRLSLDRADLWDLRTPSIYLADDWNYGTIQGLVKARNQSELVRRFDAPFEEIPYPTKLPGARLELRLEEGVGVRSFDLDLRQALGHAELDRGLVEVFFSAREPVALMRVHDVAVTYKLVAPASLKKLGYRPARVGQDRSSAWLVQRAALGLSYAVHVASRRVGTGTELAIAIVSSREAADPLALARARAQVAIGIGFVKMFESHRAWWRDFWSTSSVEVPDPALQAHYNLVQYFYGAASRRGTPPMPLQGVWTADAGELPPWKGDFHFDLNVQLSYWAYLQSGHFDEGAALLDFMWKLLPIHERFAGRFFGVQGIVVPGVMALDGQPLAGWAQYSLSPVQGAWVAQAFYLHWRYTGEADFLAERAYPYCELIARGLVSLMKPDENGRLKLPLSSSPEIHDNSLDAWMTPLTNYDLSLIRWLFASLGEMATALGKSDDAARWAGLLAQMDDLAVDAGTGALKVSPTEALTASHRHLSHLMAIHPLGTLNVEGSDRDRDVIRASLDQLGALGSSNWVGYSFAWAACAEARAGRPEKAIEYLDTFIEAFILRNGFHANGDQTRSGYSHYTYRPFTLEGNFAAAQAVHEMLLQSWGGVVRVFPAVPERWVNASFRDLRAEGGYRVNAQRDEGRTVEVRIEATRSGVLRLRNPFGGAQAAWVRVRSVPAGRTTEPIRLKPVGETYEISLNAGDVLAGRIVR
jgi:alpha-L-fucosidase 2